LPACGDIQNGGYVMTPYDLTFLLAICPVLYIAFLVFEWLEQR